MWSPYGWFGEPASAGRRPSLSIRREKLDPLLRRRAAETPGVELMLGHALTGTAPAAEGRRVELSRGPALTTRLLVGADGRGSRTAALAGVRTRTSANARFAYWGYFEGPPLGTGASVHIWFLGRDIGIATPTDGGLMLYVAFPGTERAKAFKADIEGELRAFVGALPDAPPIAESRLAGPLVGKLDLTNEWRRPGRPRARARRRRRARRRPGRRRRLRLGGPVGGVAGGGGLARPARGAPLPSALRAYRRRHRRELLGHSLMAADAARGRPMAPPQRLLFAAAVHDPVTARRIADFAAREVRPHTLLSPRALARAALVVARTRAPQPRRAARTAAP